MKALIAMSGGVDSSVAALLIKQSGMECAGCTMKLYDNDTAAVCDDRSCCSLEDIECARSVARRLGMPYWVFNFKDEFNEKVIKKFVDCYEAGCTPNPCIDCNRYLKFSKLHERAEILGYDYVVTGHYARIEKKDGEYVLKKAVDLSKDQSYVLYSMDQRQLSRTLFPLGGLTKSRARAIAEENGFINAHKPDSQDICFVPDGDYAAVISHYTGKEYPPGDFIDLDGNKIGTHRGVIHYTIGQRRGLGVSASEPYYVREIDPVKNTVTLAFERDLYSDEVFAENVNWISGRAPEGEIACKVKIRYRHQEQPATVTPLGNDDVKIVFNTPQRAVTPGQAAVFYDGDVVLGGGTIIRH